MGDSLFNDRYGLHTIELYLNNLKYTEVQKVIDYLYEKGSIHPIHEDKMNIDRALKSNYFVDDGVRLRIYQSHNKSNGIGFIINPSTLLKECYAPLALWTPTKDGVAELLDRIKGMMKKLGLDTSHVKALTLSQMDMTINEPLPKGSNSKAIIRDFRRGLLPRYFEEVPCKDKEIKSYIFEMKSKGIAFKVYDKTYELKKNNRCPKEIEDKTYIRMEVSLKREEFFKKLPLKRTDSLYKMLSIGYKSGQDLIIEYMKKSCLYGDKNEYYKNAKRIICEKVSDKSLQKQMLYFLKKLKEFGSEDIALDKLMAHYKNVDSQQIEKISKRFKKLGIRGNPFIQK